ncbi:MAG: IclR family transcriptional regulator [Alphaproteobacteria bacterium]|nr:IclR family transcriptional regulator [Alphaproteobacteria bacterium]
MVESSPPAEASAGRGGDLAAGKPVGAVINCILILRYLAGAGTSIRLTQVARDLGLNPSTCFNILQTLVAEKFVLFERTSKTYRIGYGVLDIARSAAITGGDVGVIRPAMQQIAQEHGVTVSLWRRVSEARMLLILLTPSPKQTRIQMSIGQRLPLLVGASGRAMAAFAGLDDSDLERHFREVRWNRPVSFDAFMQDIREARQRGWAVDNGDYASGTVSISAPIFDEGGIPVLACTATMFANQYTASAATRLAKDLCEITAAASPISGSLR